MQRIALAFLIVLVAFASAAQAQCPKCGQFHPPYNQPAVRFATVRNTVTAAANFVNGPDDALAEVNAKRARQGLYPLLPDPGLTTAARACANERARRRIRGHLRNDFAHVPAGTRASGAGCAAWPPSMGWGSCYADTRSHRYGGAAYAIGPDGLRYMHLFVR